MRFTKIKVKAKEETNPTQINKEQDIFYLKINYEI